MASFPPLFVKKEDTADVGVVDLLKVAVVHYNPTLGLLEFYSTIDSKPAVYSEELYDFQFVEISMGGSVRYINKSAQQIVELYGIS